MPEIAREIIINAPAEQVWKVVSDFAGIDAWSPSVAASRHTGELRACVGTKRELHHSSGLLVVQEVTEWSDGDKNLAFRITNGFGPVDDLTEVWSISSRSPQQSGADSQDVPGVHQQDTTVSVLMSFKTRRGLVSATVGRMLYKKILTKELTQSLAGLKHHIETGKPVTAKTTGLPLSSVN